MTTVEEFEKRIQHALKIPYKDGLQTFTLMDKVGVNKDNASEVRNFYYALKNQRNPKKGGDLKFEKIGRKKVNFFPENAELANKKWGFEKKSDKGDEYLDLRRSHSCDIQEVVVKPLYDRFKNILYGWEFIEMNDNERKLSAEKGAYYCEVSWGGEMGMHVDIYHKVKSTVLLEDYLKYHAPFLATMIENFDEEYNEFWKNYYEIHERIQKIIVSRMRLPITMNDLGNTKNSLNYYESVTTNLQYKLADYVSYGNAFNSNYFSLPFSVKEHDEMFECWFSDENPEQCFLREKRRGRNTKEFQDQIDKKIHMMFQDIKKSVRLQELSNKIQRLRDSLWEHQCEILRNLERDLNKKVLDGICEFCTIKNEVEKEKREEKFDVNILHRYFHEHD